LKSKYSYFEEREFILLLILSVIISFSWLGQVSLFDVDETVFAQATKEMLNSGDYITPRYNDINRYDKPILFYWLMALSYKIFGINEVGARLVSALSAVILSLGLYTFIKEFIPEKDDFRTTAFYGALSFILSVYFFVYSHAAVTDMLLSLCITFSLFSFYRWFACREEKQIYFLMIFTGLGFLTKGLIAIVLPGFIILLFLILQKDFKSILVFFHPKYLLCFCIVGLPWYIAQFSVNGNEFIEQFFLKHHFKRYTEVISSHGGPVYFYVICLFAGTFPWLFYLISNIKDFIKKRDPLIIFCAIWFLSFFIFFSLSTTKLPNYILPGIAPFFILTGISIKKAEFNVSFNNYIMIILGILNLAALFFIIEKYPDFWGSIIIFLFLQAGLFLAYQFLYKRQLIYIFSVFLVNILFLTFLFMPVANKILQRTLYVYSLYINEATNSEEKILMYKVNKPSVLFYSDRKVIHIPKNEMLEEMSSSMPRYAVSFNKDKDIKVMLDFGYKMLNNDRKYVLYERDIKEKP